MTDHHSPSNGKSHAARLADDVQARKDALDVSRSFLVQAPAGSGKTDLLTKRILALLSVVDEPEEILAITFTVGATAEMRNRVMEALAAAKPLLGTHPRPQEHSHAIAALERSIARDWALLEQPQRLNIQTIDALCLSIAYSAPLLSRLGGQFQPTEDAGPLYAMAARRTLEQLGGDAPQLSESLETLLRLRDVNLTDCEKLIADMLGARDQWLEEVSLARSLSEEDWLLLRHKLEAPFKHERDYVLNRVRELLQNHEHEVRRLLVLIREVCEGAAPPAEIEKIHGMSSLEELLSLEHFNCLRSLLLTQANSWRKRVWDAPGFKPVTRGGKSQHHDEFKSILHSVKTAEGLLEALAALASMPELTYTQAEWKTIRSVFTVLLHAVGQLRVAFNERGRMDFVEAGLTAAWALQNDEVRQGVSQRTRHLLVDEFQDTSRKQYDLLKSIVKEWDPHEHRTCFFVGDPMQSIYLFRNAELALFDEVQRHGFGPDAPGLEFQHLTLSQNFRSIEAIVEPINKMFEASRQAGVAGASRFTPAVAATSVQSDHAFVMSAHFLTDESRKGVSSPGVLNNECAAPVLEALQEFLPRLNQARADGTSYRIGILVRAKNHVAHIASALRDQGIPFRAVEIETLNERQEVRDLLSLVRALTQPMDRVAWLAILRAPWCGLSLADLHILAGSDDRSQLTKPIWLLLNDRLQLISEDGQLRARHLRAVLQQSLYARHSGAFLASPNGFAAWIEQTWRSLGGQHCVDENAKENVDAFFKLLSTLQPWEATGDSFDARIEKLFAAPDVAVQERCSIQLMTIHKAKGLGFDVVLLPELQRRSGRHDQPLLRGLSRLERGGTEKELLIAPIGIKGQPSSPTYEWIGKLIERDEREELQRLFYVACTRARSALHLFARITPKEGKGLPAPNQSVLLACGWEYLGDSVKQQYKDWQHSRVADRKASARSEPLAAFPSRPSPLLDLAAGAELHLQARRRLPSSWIAQATDGMHMPEQPAPALYSSPERLRQPSLVARARGTTLHALFEQLASLPSHEDRWDLRKHEARWKTMATTLLRSAGLLRREVEAEAAWVLSMLAAAANDPVARWMLGEQAFEQNEASWTVLEKQQLRTLRCDRIFIAAGEPLKSGQDHLWIVDYKTADAEAPDSFLLEEQSRYAPQLQRYAEALSRSAQFAEKRLPIILALYYPALQRLQWWPA